MDFEPTWEDLKRYDDENRALRAEVERLTRERDELLRDIKNGMRVAWALTQETQTVEDMATDLVRQVREARQQRDEAQANLDRVAKTLAIVLGVSFESARDLPEKCSIGQMMPLQRAEKAEADNERLREALREVLTFDARYDKPECLDRAREALKVKL